ncbi:glutathione S-transferase family protein [Phreatobacter stygius]|uniref:Glutathione S-transferase family protein n=1 Tax=Phreatobacter stygius TaxID=1940610 RepID=A0A4D7B9Y8_9HYPH|nr:glutathione S-transferase family protein [Phreatobacter stygius]QCI67410.1 glutathione S-transferase family protein [Phreatobacter stygius]
MKLYYCDTLNPRKTCAVARYLNSPVTFVPVDLGKGENRKPEFLAINPNGKVPVLTDGDRTLWESNAIMCYLADKVGSDLWPHDGRQIEIMRWLSWDAQHFTHHGGALYFEYLIKPRFGMGDPDRAAVDEATRYWRKYAGILNDHLTGRDWLVGDGLTVADFAVAVTLPYADRAHIPLGEFPAVGRWHDRLNQMEAWRMPFPAMTEPVA